MGHRRQIALALTGVMLAGCGGGGTTAEGDGAALALVAYSTPQDAYEALTAAFAATEGGAGVTFSQSYGSSGDQSRAVEAGQPADVVAFSLEPDMTRLVEAELVAGDWADDEHDGMVTESVVVLVVREGNPEGIDGWDDLIQDGIEVVTPNPFTSGGARWNVMAAYGAQLKQGRSHDEAVQYLHDLFANVVVQDDSARKSLQTFSSGKGDVLIAYENEAIFAQQSGESLEYIVPDETILIENPIAMTTTTEHEEQARAFVDFVHNDEGQTIFAENGYRPVVDGIDSPFDLPTPTALFEIDEFGGWDQVMADFFDPEGSVMADVEASIGVDPAGG